MNSEIVTLFPTSDKPHIAMEYLGETPDVPLKARVKKHPLKNRDVAENPILESSGKLLENKSAGTKKRGRRAKRQKRVYQNAVESEMDLYYELFMTEYPKTIPCIIKEKKERGERVNRSTLYNVLGRLIKKGYVYQSNNADYCEKGSNYKTIEAQIKSRMDTKKRYGLSDEMLAKIPAHAYVPTEMRTHIKSLALVCKPTKAGVSLSDTAKVKRYAPLLRVVPKKDGDNPLGSECQSYYLSTPVTADMTVNFQSTNDGPILLIYPPYVFISAQEIVEHLRPSPDGMFDTTEFCEYLRKEFLTAIKPVLDELGHLGWSIPTVDGKEYDCSFSKNPESEVHFGLDERLTTYLTAQYGAEYVGKLSSSILWMDHSTDSLSGDNEYETSRMDEHLFFISAVSVIWDENRIKESIIAAQAQAIDNLTKENQRMRKLLDDANITEDNAFIVGIAVDVFTDILAETIDGLDDDKEV